MQQRVKSEGGEYYARQDDGVMNHGERLIVKSTPLGRAPQVKRELGEDEMDFGENDDDPHSSKRSSLHGFDAVYTEEELALCGGQGTLSPNSSLGSGHEPGGVDVCGGVVVDIKFRPPRKAPVGGKWTEEEDQRLREIVEQYGAKNWKRLASILGTIRSDVQCLHRWNKVLRPGLSKGPWTSDEDQKVRDMVQERGAGNIKWSVIASQLPGRIGKQCRERWFNHLDPEIKKGDWSWEEDNVLFETQMVHGNRWSEIAKLLPGRTENAVKNRWNSSARKKWLQQNNMTEEMMIARSTDLGFSSMADMAHTAAGTRGQGSMMMPPPSEEENDNGGSPLSNRSFGSSRSNATGYTSPTDGSHEGAASPPRPILQPQMRPPMIKIGSSGSGLLDGPPSLLNSPISQLLDSVQSGLLGVVDELPISDDGLNFNFNSTLPPTPTVVPEREQEDDSDLRADDMDFASTVDLLSSSEFTNSTPTNDAMAKATSPPNNIPQRRGPRSPRRQQQQLARPPLPPCATSPPVRKQQQSPSTMGAITTTTSSRAPEVVPTEQLQRAATVAVEQIVAASKETEVPLSMLPYYHFLNERGQRSIMNQLMVQFAQTSIEQPSNIPLNLTPRTSPEGGSPMPTSPSPPSSPSTS